MVAGGSCVGPTSASERLVALDVLRGFALYGVFVVNATVSARPFEEAIRFPADASLSEQLAWAGVSGLFVGKFVALFSLLFGMGLVLQCERIAARGGPPRLYLKRLGWLALFGLLHGVLLFEGDILLPYALFGLLLYRWRARSARFLLGAALAFYLVGLGLEALGSLEGLEDPDFDRLLRTSHEVGPLSLLLRVRATEYAGWLLISSLSMFNWQVVTLFLVGAAAMKLGWLQGQRSGLYRHLGIVGCVGGFSLELAALWLERNGRGAPGQVTGAWLFALASLFLAAGYAGLVLWCVQARLGQRLQSVLAAVGRLALTNYIAQSVAMNLFFYWFGLGLWDQLTRWQVLGLVCGSFLLQALASVLWLRRFRLGPLEWLWRRLTYGVAMTR